MLYDIIVVGGGPAGLTAAIYGARAGKSVLLAERESIGGQIVYSPQVENYPALPHVSGAELASKMYEQVEALGVEIISEEATGAERQEDGTFLLSTDYGSHRGRSLILATGVQHRRLGLPGEEDLVGAGVSYCAVCDGAFYAGKDVAVVGGGDTALQDALFLSNTCRSVTVVVRRDRWRGEAALARQLEKRSNIAVLFEHRPVEYVLDGGELRGLTVEGREGQRTIPVEGVFLAIGQEPCSAAFAALAGVDVSGYFAVGERCRTDVPGLYVAGDCRTKEVRQLTTAVGDGAVAALAACADLDARAAQN